LFFLFLFNLNLDYLPAVIEPAYLTNTMRDLRALAFGARGEISLGYLPMGAAFSAALF
jgi:hypothetical protein